MLDLHSGVPVYRQIMDQVRGAIASRSLADGDQLPTGTFISAQKMKRRDAERERQLAQIVGDCVSRAGAAGFTVDDLMDELRSLTNESGKRR
jgi:GntR family transcriptional regulator